MRILRNILLITLFLQFVVGQQTEESHLKCSRGKTAKALLVNYSKATKAQMDYDANFYDIDLKIDPETQTIAGIVGVKGSVLANNFNSVELDLRSNLNVESVKNSQGNALNYSHSSNILTITLDTPLNSGDNFYVIIEYGGNPQSTGFGSFGFNKHPNNSSGKPMIWSLSEPYGARDWWPCKDTPNDKADSVDISLEVPSELIAASNGKLINTEINGDWTTYHWQERYPIATYLVSVAIHPYTVFYDWYKYSPTDSMRLEYYVFPSNFDAVQNNYALTKDMIGIFADRFGEYPFIKEKYGHAEFVWGGGMEHQTLSSLGGHQESLIAHELGHQWWGDMVTCGNFHHIWLNEGFATYSEALWYEKYYGEDRLHQDMSYNVYYQGGKIFVDDTTSVNRIFHGGLSYAKASWVLHMLRHVVGDTAFFSGIREYGERYRFKSAVTEQFQAVMEEISGKDLGSFFQRWIYGEYYPIYAVTYNFTNDLLYLLIQQTQNSAVFEMPIDIKATFTDNTQYTWVVNNTIREQYYKLDIPSGKQIQRIEIDPDNWILKKIGEIHLDTTNNFIVPNEFQLYPVYPNPFNAEATIRFALDNEGIVLINIFDMRGKKVWTLSNIFQAGIHSVRWNGKNNLGDKVPSGTYLVEANNNKLTKTTKMLLIK